MSSMRSNHTTPPKAVLFWLIGVYILILSMVAVGGITRLTGSGLSMTEWHPLMGWIPPLNHEDWLDVFELYKASPQYLEVNAWMGLEDFKQIFFWEYVHRVLGRVIGLAFFLPWLFFVMRRHIRGVWILKTLVAFVLGGAQGFMGWFMVQSGLVDVPEVSHFRLAAHLSLAFILGTYVLWLALDCHWGRANRSVRRLMWPVLGFAGLLAVQVVYGAFMAGKRAGVLYPSFPDFLGQWFPSQAWEGTSMLSILLDNAHMIHAIHRWLAWLVVLVGCWVAVSVYRHRASPRQGRTALLLLSVLAGQFVLGALTVIWAVPLWTAVAHQVLGFVLVSITGALLHATVRVE